MPRETVPAFTRTVVPLLSVTALTGVFDGTGAITLIDSLPVTHKFTLEKLRWVSSSIATGAGGTQTFKIRKGGAAGTVIATLTIALADTNAVGKFKEYAVTAADDANATFKDGDTISFTRDASGTAFTKAEGLFSLVTRQRPQARI